jgi:polygalacturonase
MADDWFNVRSPQYGAAGNRATDDTAAFAAVLDASAAAGGGVLYIAAFGRPVYLSGSWSLASGTAVRTS